MIKRRKKEMEKAWEEEEKEKGRRGGGTSRKRRRGWRRGATLRAACAAHLRMTVNSWSLDGFVKIGECVDTSQEYVPEDSKSMFLSRICRSLLSFHCKTK
jgi:adenylosuccinate synthase